MMMSRPCPLSAAWAGAISAAGSSDAGSSDAVLSMKRRRAVSSAFGTFRKRLEDGPEARQHVVGRHFTEMLFVSISLPPPHGFTTKPNQASTAPGAQTSMSKVARVQEWQRQAPPNMQAEDQMVARMGESTIMAGQGT